MGTSSSAYALRSNTTTEFTPEEVHVIGLAEVDRITKEMDAVLAGIDLTEGSVAERMRTLAKSDDQLYPNTDAGRGRSAHALPGHH